MLLEETKHHPYAEETHTNTTSLTYQRNTYRHYIDYIDIKEIPTYTTSRIHFREVHTGTATYARLELIICLLFQE